MALRPWRCSTWRRPSVLLVAAQCCHCHPGYEPPDWSRVSQASGLDPAKSLVDLTADERKTLCEWKVVVFGGFGRSYRMRGTCRFSTYTRRVPSAVSSTPRKLHRHRG